MAAADRARFPRELDMAIAPRVGRSRVSLPPNATYTWCPYRASRISRYRGNEIPRRLIQVRLLTNVKDPRGTRFARSEESSERRGIPGEAIASRSIVRNYAPMLPRRCVSGRLPRDVTRRGREGSSRGGRRSPLMWFNGLRGGAAEKYMPGGSRRVADVPWNATKGWIARSVRRDLGIPRSDDIRAPFRRHWRRSVKTTERRNRTALARCGG